MIKFMDNNPAVHYYVVDYNTDLFPDGIDNWCGAICYPSLRTYDNLVDFFNDKKNARRIITKTLTFQTLYFTKLIGQKHTMVTAWKVWRA